MIERWEKELRNIAIEKFKLKKKKLKKIKIEFKPRSSNRCLGYYLNKTIFINKAIYELSGEKYYYVFRHEYGHFLTSILFKNVYPHGKEWKYVMRVLGDDKPRATTTLFSKEIKQAFKLKR